MARFLRYILPLILLLNNSPANANFVIQSPPSDTGPELASSSATGGSAPSAAQNSSQPVDWKLAYGFGNNVPLQFACRQIVPPAVKVLYGTGVNPAIPVTWKGGDTWNHVLRDTVKPFGFRLQMTYMAVTIVKNTSP